MRRSGDARADIGDGKAVSDTGGAALRPRAGVTPAAATDPALHRIVLLVTSESADDQTWTLSGDTRVRHQAAP
jgi:hypothetical protein